MESVTVPFTPRQHHMGCTWIFFGPHSYTPGDADPSVPTQDPNHDFYVRLKREGYDPIPHVGHKQIIRMCIKTNWYLNVALMVRPL